MKVRDRFLQHLSIYRLCIDFLTRNALVVDKLSDVRFVQILGETLKSHFKKKSSIKKPYAGKYYKTMKRKEDWVGSFLMARAKRSIQVGIDRYRSADWFSWELTVRFRWLIATRTTFPRPTMVPSSRRWSGRWRKLCASSRTRKASKGTETIIRQQALRTTFAHLQLEFGNSTSEASRRRG